MREAPIPDNEAQRLAALRALEILDTAPEERFDRITRLAQRMFDVPISTVTLVDADRQWFKSQVGLDNTGGPRSESFCAHAILEPEVMVIPDALLDARFADNPLVLADPKIRFYAGAPIAASDGSQIGTLCVIDRRPREFTEADVQSLKDLAAAVQAEIIASSDANTDELTGLLNRRGFRSLGEALIRAADIRGGAVELLYIDLDDMKGINDSLGHEAGDRAVRETAALLTSVFRASDISARVGGDEFCVLMAHFNDARLGAPAERLQAAAAAADSARQEAYALSLSVGVATWERGESLDSLMARADAEMYRVKSTR